MLSSNIILIIVEYMYGLNLIIDFTISVSQAGTGYTQTGAKLGVRVYILYCYIDS